MRTITIAALALGLMTIGASAQAPHPNANRYEGFTAGAGRILWRLDTLTGRVSVCIPEWSGREELAALCTKWADESTPPRRIRERLLTDEEFFGDAGPPKGANPFDDLIPKK